jgi:hypothetical protein
MKYRKLDADGDYSFGQNRFLHDTEAVGQAIVTRMKLLYGEWWECTDDGLPLFEQILGVFADEQKKNAVDLIISERISGTRGVRNITRFKSEFHNRRYSAHCTVNTIFGDIEFEIADGARKVEVKY